MKVRELTSLLSQFDEELDVIIPGLLMGDTKIELRDYGGRTVVGIFNNNGGRFGENPLTDAEYEARKEDILKLIDSPNYRYTPIHGDHRWFDLRMWGPNATSFGNRFDERIVNRMVEDKIIEPVGHEGFVRCHT